MTGGWFGRYAYPEAGEPPVAFWAAIVEGEGGAFEGTTSESNMLGDGSDLLEAVLRGVRAGRTVSFVKAYDGASDAAHAVDYAGELDAAGELLTGRWTLEGLVGDFEMRRRHIDEEAEEQDRLEEADIRA